MSNSGTVFPFVCKYYNATCPLVIEDIEFQDFTVAFYDKKAGEKLLFFIF